MNNNNFKALFQVLSSEQQILMRTDQKAFTLLSILGVFMIFFIFSKLSLPHINLILSSGFFYPCDPEKLYYLIFLMCHPEKNTKTSFTKNL